MYFKFKALEAGLIQINMPKGSPNGYIYKKHCSLLISSLVKFYTKGHWESMNTIVRVGAYYGAPGMFRCTVHMADKLSGINFHMDTLPKLIEDLIELKARNYDV